MFDLLGVGLNLILGTDPESLDLSTCQPRNTSVASEWIIIIAPKEVKKGFE